MKAFQLKYANTRLPDGTCESITGSSNNPNGRHRQRSRRWRGPRSKLLSASAKRLARVIFDQEVKRALA